MKKLIGLFVVLVLIVSVNAQTVSKKYMEKVKTQVEEMATVMKLDDGQKAKVLELKTKLAINNTELNKKFDKGSEEFKAAKKEANASFYAQLKETCTKEQIKLWGTHKKAQKTQ